MSAAKHTPGPWRAFGDEVYGADGARVAEAVAERDKALVLAAPHLLEFVQEVRRCGSPRLSSMAIAVIATAEAQ